MFANVLLTRVFPPSSSGPMASDECKVKGEVGGGGADEQGEGGGVECLAEILESQRHSLISSLISTQI
jgi:hypothetical protein